MFTKQDPGDSRKKKNYLQDLRIMLALPAYLPGDLRIQEELRRDHFKNQHTRIDLTEIRNWSLTSFQGSMRGTSVSGLPAFTYLCKILARPLWHSLGIFILNWCNNTLLQPGIWSHLPGVTGIYYCHFLFFFSSSLHNVHHNGCSRVKTYEKYKYNGCFLKFLDHLAMSRKSSKHLGKCEMNKLKI